MIVLLLDLADSIAYFFSKAHYYAKEYTYFTSIFVFFATKYGDRFYRNFMVDLNYHAVFYKIDEAYLNLQRIPYKTDFRRETILLWHKIVLKHQKDFCTEVVKMLSDGKGRFSERSAHLAQEMLNNFTVELQNSLPPKVERYYSSFAYLGRDQLRDVVFHYAQMKGLTNKEKAEKYLENVSFFSKYIFLIATFQNDLNGELNNIAFRDHNGDIIYDYPKNVENNENDRLTP